jgi:hypothetical protein
VKQTTNAEIAQAFLAFGEQFQSTIIRIYSGLHMAEPVALPTLGHPYSILYGKYGPCVAQSVEFRHLVNERQPLFSIYCSECQLPEFDSIIIAAPAVHDAQGTSEVKAAEVFAVLEACMAISFGRFGLTQLVQEIRVTTSGEVQSASPVIRVPESPDYHQVATFGELATWLAGIGSAEAGLSIRVKRALEFVSQALKARSSEMQFSNYWVGMEVLAEGKARKIKAVLSQHYGLGANNSTVVDRKLGFSRISETRHHLFHEGVFSAQDYEPVVRRMTEAAIADLLDARLNLPLRSRLQKVYESFKEYSFPP